MQAVQLCRRWAACLRAAITLHAATPLDEASARGIAAGERCHLCSFGSSCRAAIRLHHTRLMPPMKSRASGTMPLISAPLKSKPGCSS